MTQNYINYIIGREGKMDSYREPKYGLKDIRAVIAEIKSEMKALRPKGITIKERARLIKAVNKERTKDLIAYRKDLEKMIAKGQHMAGFTQENMGWLYDVVRERIKQTMSPLPIGGIPYSVSTAVKRHHSRQ